MYNWFKAKVSYDKTMENGIQKKVSEEYLFDALSYTEAEARVIEELDPYITGEFVIADIKRARYSETYIGSGEYFFDAKIAFITLDEKSGGEKKTTVKMLLQADRFEEAKTLLDEKMKGTLADYRLLSLSENNIFDVFPYSSESNTEPVKLDIPEENKVEQNDEDPLFEDAKKLVIEKQEATTSMLQRKFSIGYNRAGRLMELLERAGVVGETNGVVLGTTKRKVLISKT